MVDENLLKSIKRCKIALQRDYPFFSDLLFFITVKEGNDEVPTAKIDIHGNLTYNSKFMAGLNDDEKKVVICHEVIHCLESGTIVGDKNIEDILNNDMVVSADGKFHSVLRCARRRYLGKIVSVKPRGCLPFCITPNHRVLVTEMKGWKTKQLKSGRGRGCRRNVRMMSKLKWIEANRLTKDHYLIMPKLKADKRLHDFCLSLKPYVSGNAWSVKKTTIKLNPDVAFMLGRFTADGYTDKCKKSNGVYFVFNIRKEKDADKIMLILKDEFNLKARKIFDKSYARRVKNPKGVWRVLFGSAVLKRFLRDNIGTYSYNKHIPNWLMQHPDIRIVKAYLQGLFGGDGWLNKNKSGNSVGFCTTSKSLVIQLQILLTRIGVFGRIYAREGGVCALSGNPAKKQYILCCQEKTMFDILGFAYKKMRPTKCYVDFGENFAVKITGVEKKDYDGEVFNLSTETQTYLANNVVVHNCGLLHLARGHSIVQSPEYWEIYNIAADAVTNYILAENGFMFSKKITSIIPDVYGNNVQLKTESGTLLYTVEKIKEKTVEKVFHELCKNLPITYIKVHIVGAKGDGSGIKRFDIHGFGEGKEASQKAEKEWKQRLINAVARAKSIGKLPSGIDRYVDKILEPKVRWQDILYRFITEQMPHDFTYCLDAETRVNVLKGTVMLSYLKKGDAILGWDGYNVVKTKVLEKFEDIRKKEKYVIYTSSGKRIICSSDHKFFIDGKFVKAKNIKRGDILNTL